MARKGVKSFENKGLGIDICLNCAVNSHNTMRKLSYRSMFNLGGMGHKISKNYKQQVAKLINE